MAQRLWFSDSRECNAETDEGSPAKEQHFSISFSHEAVVYTALPSCYKALTEGIGGNFQKASWDPQAF